MVFLIGQDGIIRGSFWEIHEHPLVIGSEMGCDIIVPDPSVPARHSEVHATGDALHVTYLNDSMDTVDATEKVETKDFPQPATLWSGDVFTVSDFTFRVEKNIPKRGEFEQAITTHRAQPLVIAAAEGDRSKTPEIPERGVALDKRDLTYMIRRSDYVRQQGIEYFEAASKSALLDRFLDTLGECFEPDLVWLAEPEGGDGALSIRGARGADVSPAEEAPLRTMAFALAKGQGLLIPNGEPVAGGAAPSTTLIVPIQGKDRGHGAVAISVRGPARKYDDADLWLLLALAHHLGRVWSIVTDQGPSNGMGVRRRSDGSDPVQLLGTSKAARHLRKLVRGAAKIDINVLIQGETGTGKELVAQLIHKHDRRAKGPFVVVNCPAIPNELFESELFGHEEGSFTGAGAQKVGLAEKADGGTLFLDEIGDLSLAHQARILRVIEDGVLRRVGGSEEIQVRFRTLAATNRDLTHLVKSGAFREDLYHRLNAFEIQVPPLRKRPSDVAVLGQYFLNQRTSARGESFERLTPDALDFLQAQPFPGNVRELKNRIYRAAANAKTPVLTVADLVGPSRSLPQNPAAISRVSLFEAEKRHIAGVLKECGGNVREAAEILEVSRSTLYKKIRDHNLSL